MINDFLKKYGDELLVQITKLQSEIKNINDNITENQGFYNILTVNSDKYNNDFSPRNTNAKNSEKAAEVLDIIDSYKSQLVQKEKELKELQSKLNELNTISHEALEADKPQEKKTENPLKNKLVSIKQYVYVDPHRAVQQLDSLIASLDNDESNI